MARVDIGGYRIESYPEGWMLGELMTRGEDAKDPGEQYVAKIRYYGRVEQAFGALLERRLRSSDAESVNDLVAEIEALKRDLLNLFSIKVTFG